MFDNRLRFCYFQFNLQSLILMNLTGFWRNTRERERLKLWDSAGRYRFIQHAGLQRLRNPHHIIPRQNLPIFSALTLIL